MKTKIILTAFCALSVWQAKAQTYDTNNVVVQTFAGSGFSGNLDGQGTQTMFKGPRAIVADTASNLFVMDMDSRIRKITPDGTVTTFAGGSAAQPPGYGTNVAVSVGIEMTIDHSNNLFYVDYAYGNALWRVGSDGYVTRIPLDTLNHGGSGVRDGICVDSGNNVYISGYPDNKIYRYTTNGVLELFVGSGNSGSVDGNGIFTSFNSPSFLTSDSADNIYVWDSANWVIRRINQNRDVVTIAGRFGRDDTDGYGTNAGFYGISSMCSDNAGNIYLAAHSGIGGSTIRKISATTNVTTLAGSFTLHGYVNGAGSTARFELDAGICFSQGAIFVADVGNQRIRQISFNPSPQVVTGANLGIGTFAGVTITGTVGRTYQVQSSADMTNWTTRATLLLTSSPFLWIDQNPVSGNKFYRALLLP